MELDDIDLHDLDDDDEDLRALYDATPARRGRRGKPYRLFAVIKKTAFDYTFLAPSTNTSVVLRRAIALPAHYWYWFGLRVHNHNIAGGDFSFKIFNTLPSSEDPREFSSGGSIVGLPVTGASAAPSLEFETESFQGPYAKVEVSISQSTGVPPLPLYVEASLVLLARAH